MKCGNYIIWRERVGKHGKVTRFPYLYFSRYQRIVAEVPVPEEATLCDGDITFEIDAREDPFFGGSTAVLDVRVTCSACGFADPREYPTLPRDLSAFVTKMIAKEDESVLEMEKKRILQREHDLEISRVIANRKK